MREARPVLEQAPQTDLPSLPSDTLFALRANSPPRLEQRPKEYSKHKRSDGSNAGIQNIGIKNVGPRAERKICRFSPVKLTIV